MNPVTRITGLTRPIVKGLDFVSPVLDVVIRLWVANVFWKSGVTKFQSWDTTVALFTYEYQVPLLSPTMAAALGTAVELAFPVLLVLGLMTRFSAAVLFVFNIAAVLSYPELNEIGLKDHQYWGLLLLVPLLHGPGKISLDHAICTYWARR